MIEASVLAIVMLCSGISAAAFTAFLLRRRQPKEKDSPFPILPGQVGVDGDGRHWRIVSRTLSVEGPGRAQRLRLDLVEGL